MVFRHEDKNGEIVDTEIKKIYLNEKLKKEALSSSINKYVKGNYIIVVEDIKASETFLLLSQAGKTDLALSQFEYDKLQGYPTKDKCKDIINWLCCNNNSIIITEDNNESVILMRKRKK